LHGQIGEDDPTLVAGEPLRIRRRTVRFDGKTFRQRNSNAQDASSKPR